MENNYAFTISPEDLQKVNDAIKVINDTLTPKLIALTPDNRKELNKMGDKTLSFVNKSVEYMQLHPNLVPRYVQVEPAKIDLEATQTLLPLHNQFTILQEMTSDSSMLSGSEAYGSALTFYNSIKLQAKENVTGAKAIYEDLKVRFPGKRTKKELV
jgi:hydroxymethylpyrimidine/phosphomethylpyrimidine kinase